MKFTIYDLYTGVVLRSGVAPGDVLNQVGAGEGGLPMRVDPAMWYFDLVAEELREKTDLVVTVAPETIPADGDTFTSISGIPNGATVFWPDGQHTVADGEPIEFAVDLPGRHLFFVFSVEYLTKEITIEAIAAT